MKYVPYSEIDDFGCWLPLDLCLTFTEGKCGYESVEELLADESFCKEVKSRVRDIDAITCIKEPIEDIERYLYEKEHVRRLNFLVRRKCSSSNLG